MHLQKGWSNMGGPTVDGKGTGNVRTTNPVDAVDVSVRSDVPGGESKKGSQWRPEGPNSAKGK